MCLSVCVCVRVYVCVCECVYVCVNCLRRERESPHGPGYLILGPHT